MNKTNSLTPEVKKIVKAKGTEAPFSGTYYKFSGLGSYLCRCCGLALFRSTDKFLSQCGWPSFDNEIEGALSFVEDEDGRRTEVLCRRCDSHMGHVFQGEYLTEKNTRHCINSLAIDFVASDSVLDSRELIVAGGCFWGIQALLAKEPGVIKTEVGYCGGSLASPSYQAVCRGDTGHVEAVRVIYDTALTNDSCLIEAFFEVHDPQQRDGQGGDRGSQYLSTLFYYDFHQHQAVMHAMATLSDKGINVATNVFPATIFWPAEDSHQEFILKHPGTHCHSRVKRF